MAFIIKAPDSQAQHARGEQLRAASRVSEGESLTGPDVIRGLVRDVAPNTSAYHHVTLWDDPMARTIYHTDEFEKALNDAYDNNKPVAVTTEKIKGKWTVTKVEET